MKKLQGKTRNITNTVIGIITHNKRRFLQPISDVVLVSDNFGVEGYAAIITGSKQFDTKSKSKFVHSVDFLENLFDGDIVSIDPDGKINVLYEINSIHNVLFITERCNANCIMCPQPPNNFVGDNLEQVWKVISLMDKGSRQIGITGGEPTLVGDDLFKIIESIKKRFKKSSVTLLTNAIKLSDFEYTKKFALINHPDLQIDVPLYSDTDTEHNKIIRAKGFYKTIKGLYNLATINQKVGIRVVVHKMNYKRLPQIAEFIYRNFPFVVNIAFMQMELMGNANENINELWIDPYDYNPELEQAVDFLSNTDLNVSIYNSQLCILPEKLKKHAKQSISTWKNIFLPECQNCASKFTCPGLFSANEMLHSKHIKSL